MKQFIAIIVCLLVISCSPTSDRNTAQSDVLPLKGTWKLIAGTLTESGKTTVTDYTKNTSFIKIINNDHFAFLQHDLTHGKDSATFVAGGGPYTLKDSSYTEHLEYCNAREWEGHDFTFTIHIQHDTLTSKGIEKIEGTNVNRLNVEVYKRIEH